MSIGKELKARLDAADEIKPLMTFNGEKVYSFADATEAIEAELIIKKAGFETPQLADRSLNKSGETYTRLNKKYPCVIPGQVMNNRFRKVPGQKGKDGKANANFEVVVDYMALQTQASGQAYRKGIVAHIIKAVKTVTPSGVKDVPGTEKLEIQYLGTKVVDSDVFCRDFNSRFDEETMKQILPLIESAQYVKGATPERLSV